MLYVRCSGRSRRGVMMRVARAMSARCAIRPLCAALALGALGCLTARAADTGPDASIPPRTVVFVGERQSIESVPDPCQAKAKATGVLDCISMDALYQAAYLVVRPLVGELAGEVLAFSVADH